MSRSSAPTPDQRPEILVDRCVGLIAIPDFFRSVGFTVHTIPDTFGHRSVPDTEWIQLAGESNWLVVSKDAAIRRRPAELEAVVRVGLRMLCLTNGHLSSSGQVECFKANLSDIDRLWHEDGPWIMAAHATKLERLDLRHVR